MQYTRLPRPGRPRSRRRHGPGWFCGPGLAHCRAGESTLLDPLASSPESRLVTAAIELELVPVRGIDLITLFPVHFLQFTETTTILHRELHLERVRDHVGRGTRNHLVLLEAEWFPHPRPAYLQAGPLVRLRETLETEPRIRNDRGNEINGRREAGLQPTHRLWLIGYTEAIKSGVRRTNIGERQDQFQSFWSVAPRSVRFDILDQGPPDR